MRPLKKHNLTFKEPLKRWDEGLPLGNGQIGSLIWGESSNLKCSIDRVDIWDNQLHPNITNENHNFEYLKQLVANEKQEEILSLFEAPYSFATPTKLPVGRIVFNFKENKTVESFLDIYRAQAKLKLKEDSNFEFKSFLHATNKCGYIKIKSKEFSYEIKNPKFDTENKEANFKDVSDSVNTGSLELLSYPPPISKNDGNFRYFIQPLKNEKKFGIFSLEKEKDGYKEIVFSVYCEKDSDDIISFARNKLEEAINEGYDFNFETHFQWWKDYWKESGVRILDDVIEKGWYFNNYLLASSSRKNCPPMPLQGLWTADDGKLPPWKGDYHHDLNTQFSYMGYLKANHLEQGESFFDFLISLQDKAKKFAKTFYKAKGSCLPSIMDIEGNPIGGWVMYAYSPTSQAWLADLFYRHAKITGDKEFLKNKAYPFLKGAAQFIIDLLEEKDGNLVLPLSASPEVNDNNYNAWFKTNTNYDISLINKLLIDIIDIEKDLNQKEYYKNILSKLPKLEIDPKIGYLVTKDTKLEETHRHFSHLMSIYPLKLVNYENDKELIDNSVNYLEKLGKGMWVGFSFVWMSILYSIQHNGEAAAFQLRLVLDYFCSINGFHINGDNKDVGLCCWKYRPFTIETNMLICEAIEEMLLFSENGEIELFPAIPERFKTDISFDQFLAWDGILVSARMKNNKIIKLEFKNTLNKSLVIKNYNSIKHFKDILNCDVKEIENNKALLTF